MNTSLSHFIITNYFTKGQGGTCCIYSDSIRGTETFVECLIQPPVGRNCLFIIFKSLPIHYTYQTHLPLSVGTSLVCCTRPLCVRPNNHCHSHTYVSTYTGNTSTNSTMEAEQRVVLFVLHKGRHLHN